MGDAEEGDQERKDREDSGWLKPEKFESGREEGMCVCGMSGSVRRRRGG